MGVLIGDIKHEQFAQVKYGYFLNAVAHRFPLIDVYNANLHGFYRLFNALISLRPDYKRWRERFYKNDFAFLARSRSVTAHLKSVQDQVDVILQMGVLFDACWGGVNLPNVIYTDYTAHLSAENPSAGRSPFTPRQRKRWLALEQQALSRARHICTRSNHVRNSILSDYGLPSDRVTTIGGGVNFSTLPELQPKSDRSEGPTILFIGKDFYRKGGDLILKAFVRVRSQIPGARLLLLTEGAVPKNYSLEGVELITPTWDRSAIRKLYRRADVFVLPSRLETWGDVLLEAMAFGLPCVGVANDAIDEIIQDEVTGCIVPPDNPEALSDILIRLLNNVPYRRELGDQGRKRVEQEYTWDRVMERLAPILQTASESSLAR
jgi:glycosyltransferase involved in cell wall biosynthesis